MILSRGEMELWGVLGCPAEEDVESDESEEPEENLGEPNQLIDDADARFRTEVDDIVKGGIVDGTKVSNIVLEIRSSLKPAYDKSFGECACAILGPLLDEFFNPDDGNSFLKVMAQWRTLVEPFVTDE